MTPRNLTPECPEPSNEWIATLFPVPAPAWTGKSIFLPRMPTVKSESEKIRNPAGSTLPAVRGDCH